MIRLSFLLALALTIGSCTTQDEPGQELSIVVSTSILGDVVSNIVGDDATVEVLIPLGADPHEFQPSSAQVARINHADLVVVNGLGLEEALLDVIAAAVVDGARVVEVGPGVRPIPYTGPGHDDDDYDQDDDDHGDDDLDPHFWMDPVRIADAARLVATELSLAQPEVDWADRAESYAARLFEADTAIEALLATVPAGERRLITNHATFGYFADRYGWEILGTVIPGGSSVGSPSSADLAALVHLIEEEGVRAIFVETSQPDALARAVAAEIGEEIAVVELHTESLSPPGTEADTVIGMLSTNARLIAESLTRGG